jgi:hypothetical protein
MTLNELLRELEANQIVALTAADWALMSDRFEIFASHDTCLAGELRIISTDVGLAAVEQPKPHLRVVRPLGDEDAVRRFVEDRMAAYDRMWDG